MVFVNCPKSFARTIGKQLLARVQFVELLHFINNSKQHYSDLLVPIFFLARDIFIMVNDLVLKWTYSLDLMG